jgi:hypothetical protein
LKSKISFLVLSTLILVAAFAAISAPIAAATPTSKHPSTYHSFILQASGHAYDPKNHKWVDVTLSLSGSVEGKTYKALTLHSKGGEVTVKGYGVFEAAKSQGVIILRKDFAQLTTMLCPSYYGGCKSVWCMWGKLEDREDGTVPIMLKAERVNLPIQGHPRLYDVHLEGTIQLS